MQDDHTLHRYLYLGNQAREGWHTTPFFASDIVYILYFTLHYIIQILSNVMLTHFILFFFVKNNHLWRYNEDGGEKAPWAPKMDLQATIQSPSPAFWSPIKIFGLYIHLRVGSQTKQVAFPPNLPVTIPVTIVQSLIKLYFYDSI